VRYELLKAGFFRQYRQAACGGASGASGSVAFGASDSPRAGFRAAQRLHPLESRQAWLGEEVMVQFWLRPGEAAVTLGPGEEREVERIPEQLWKFL